ncbi:MAG: sulfotransferase domain-containing protein [Rhodovibrionaceae bacterium]|nr:sulfotransferase domain-containing protein [Rhodovibrionaceae bacterium]
MSGIEQGTRPGGILWLASYPKSGNTWLRAFLANYWAGAQKPVPINELPNFALGDGMLVHYEQLSGKPAAELDEEEVRALRPKVHEWFATHSSETVMVKTHNYLGHEGGVPLITPHATFGAVYVVRNPLDVAVSYAHHFQASLDNAVRALTEENTILPGDEKLLPSFVGSWSQHVRSWTEMPGLHCHVMRYEDMLNKPGPTFGKLIDFLGVPREPRRLADAVKFSSFKELKKQEERDSFIEARPDGSTKFFRAGRTGGWHGELSEDQVQQIVEANAQIMRKFGYLDDKGNVTGR